MSILTTPTEHFGVLPSKANGKASNMDHGDAILDVAASCIRALGYSPPPFTHDPSLKEASVEELRTWNLGEALDDVMKYLDVGLATAECFYPSHEADVKVILTICTTCMVWVDTGADTIIEALTDFQRRFHSRLPQLHPVLDRYANYMLKLYAHYESYVASAMIMSSCAFMDASYLELRALTKPGPTKSDAKLWPYYIRNLSGVPVFYSFACFPQKDHPDLVNYIQAIPDMLIFTNFLNDVLSFYKEEMDGEQHNYCQMMSRVSGSPPINVLKDISRETVVVAKRAEKILEDSPAALKTLKDYQQGSVRFYLDAARYRIPVAWKAQFCD
ncbi:terpenoid synthase [Peniophora sp. CONT]|nr:terpenoid synthase [Peniophora sp. CONT]